MISLGGVHMHFIVIGRPVNYGEEAFLTVNTHTELLTQWNFDQRSMNTYMYTAINRAYTTALQMRMYINHPTTPWCNITKEVMKACTIFTYISGNDKHTGRHKHKTRWLHEIIPQFPAH